MGFEPWTSVNQTLADTTEGRDQWSSHLNPPLVFTRLSWISFKSSVEAKNRAKDSVFGDVKNVQNKNVKNDETHWGSKKGQSRGWSREPGKLVYGFRGSGKETNRWRLHCNPVNEAWGTASWDTGVCGLCSDERPPIHDTNNALAFSHVTAMIIVWANRFPSFWRLIRNWTNNVWLEFK